MAVEDFKEFLPADLRKRQQLIEYKKAMRQIHFPANHKELKEARKRLAFDELFLYTMALNIFVKWKRNQHTPDSKDK